MRTITAWVGVLVAVGCGSSGFSDHTVFITVSGNGGGVVTVTPGGLGCSGSCEYTVTDSSAITLHAEPDSDSSFVGWTGGGCAGTQDCTVTVTADLSIQASFAADLSLIVTKDGTGTGLITSDPAGIDCGLDCDEVYAGGETVTLSATPDSDSWFAGWSGACVGTDPCVISMTGAVMATGTFTLGQSTLTVTKSGTGSGTVSSNPAGIDCGLDCEEVYDNGTSVTLTAVPDTGSMFAGWSGGGCTGTGSCTVSVSAATDVTATFTIDRYTLTVNKAGTGAGTVTSSPSGISCGTDCTELYDYNTSVTLTASPSTGSDFAGWSGACTGTGTCTVSMTAARSVTATFNLRTYTLTVTKTGNGSGTITSNPAGINCGTDCSQVYTYGTTVTLTRSQSTGSYFNGWGGSCTGTGTTCTVTMTANRSVTAAFTLYTYTLNVIKQGSGTGTVTSNPSGISCGTDCSQVYNYGTSVTLTRTVGSGSTFAGWSGSCTGTGSTCTVTMTTSRTVYATFTSASALSCTYVTNAVSCTNGSIPEVNLGAGLSGSACRSQCQTAMVSAGMTSGCWIIALNNYCYCRSGVLNTGGTNAGGSCN